MLAVAMLAIATRAIAILAIAIALIARLAIAIVAFAMHAMCDASNVCAILSFADLRFHQILKTIIINFSTPAVFSCDCDRQNFAIA